MKRVFILKKPIKLFFFFCIVILLFSEIASANIQDENSPSNKPKLERHFVFETIPMDLEEITKASDRIFAGECTNIEEIENDKESNGLPVVKYTFKITEGIKGIHNKEKITFKQWQPTVRNTGYEIGKKYVLFLHPNSSRGLTSPVGLPQSYFMIEKKGFIRKKEVVRNRLNNIGLTKNLKTQKRIYIENNKFVDEYVNRCSELGIPIRYKEFIEAVKYLAQKN